jgi:hypothetical protein
MRPDHTQHLITAAKRRHELTRAKAIRALRELDRAGTAVTFESVARAAEVRVPGSAPNPTSTPRSEGFATRPATHRPQQSQPHNAPPPTRFDAAWQPPTNVSANSPRRTNACTGNSPTRSVTTESKH